MTVMRKLSLVFCRLERNPNDGQALLCALAILSDISRSSTFRVTSKALWRELWRVIGEN
jgi:hypothetical protein